MNKLKMIFTQSLMISSAVFFGLGIQSLINFLGAGEASFTWPWYLPLSIVLTGIVCAVPSLLFLGREEISTKKFVLRIIVHFILIGGIVTGAGFLFRWFNGWAGYLIIMALYVLIYVFVWFATYWIGKKDEKEINEKIKDFQDKD